MNFYTLSGSAKLYKKLEVCATGQATASGEVPSIAILCAVDRFENQKLIDSIASGIKAKGGIVTIVNVPAFGNLSKINPMTSKYTTSFSRTAASTAEAIIKCGLYDGIVIVADCDITAIGLLEGATKANCPALIVPIGAFNEAKKTENFKIQGKVTGGSINSNEGEALIQNAIMHPGTAHYFNSVSTFFILMESIGFCVPNIGLTIINSAAHLRNAMLTGEQICESAKSVLTPKRFLTRANLGNSIALCISIGGDISAIATITNLVRACDTKVPHEIITEFSSKATLLVAPENQNCCHLMKIGGVVGILKHLSDTSKLIDDGALAYTGNKLKNLLSCTKAADIKEVSKTTMVTLVKGSACTGGGYVQAAANTPVSIQGKAWVYNSLEEADKALTAGNIPDSSIIVVHNCLGSYVSALAYTIEGMEKQSQIAIITDGLCDKTSVLVATRCTPDSLSNQEFANIQNGDIIEIDLGRGRLNTNILSKEMANREKKNSVKKATVYFQ